MSKVIFTFEGKEMQIQCNKEEKMRDICNRYSEKINIDLNSLYFLYGGKKVNLSLSFQEQASTTDNFRNIMNILAYKNKNEGLCCQKCGAKINTDILNSILKDITKQEETLVGIKNQMENLINLYDINKIISQIKLTKIIVDNLINENKKNKEKFQNFLNIDNIQINNETQKTNGPDVNKMNPQKFEITISHHLTHVQEVKIKNVFIEAASKYTDHLDIARHIFNQLNDDQTKIIVSVGERDKYNTKSNSTKALGGNIGPYKITIQIF